MDRLQQIAAATKNARPTPQNPSWYHTHNDLVYALDQLTAANKAIVALSEALEDMLKAERPSKKGCEIIRSALTTHADAIKRAKGE